MRARRPHLYAISIVAACVAGLGWLQSHVEMAMLGTTGLNRDHFTRVFVVDDSANVWVRADRPDRLWLDGLRERPDVTLERADGPIAYRAEIWPGEDAQAYVDGLFRDKYGPVDVVTGILWRRESVPIRLEPR